MWLLFIKVIYESVLQKKNQENNTKSYSVLKFKDGRGISAPTHIVVTRRTTLGAVLPGNDRSPVSFVSRVGFLWGTIRIFVCTVR